MNRLYRVSSRRNGAWIVAPTVEHAQDLFLERGFVRALKNIVSTDDQTDFYMDSQNAGGETQELREAETASLKALLESGKTGVACIQLGAGAALSFDQVIGLAPRPKPTANQWCIA